MCLTLPSPISTAGQTSCILLAYVIPWIYKANLCYIAQRHAAEHAMPSSIEASKSRAGLRLHLILSATEALAQHRTYACTITIMQLLGIRSDSSVSYHHKSNLPHLHCHCFPIIMCKMSCRVYNINFNTYHTTFFMNQEQTVTVRSHSSTSNWHYS